MTTGMGSRSHDHDAAATRVVQALSRLGGDWTVLDSPRFGLEQPDAVALHPLHGVAVVTVTALRPHEVERDADGMLTVPDHPERRLAEQPHLLADRITAHVADEHYAGVDIDDVGDAVRRVIVAPLATDAEARALFAPRGSTEADVALAVWGSGFEQAVERAVLGRRATSVPPPPGTTDAHHPVDATGLRRLLDAAVLGPDQHPSAPSSVAIQRAAISLVADPTGSPLRRVRGPGGSGKTFALTARAAELARAGKRVLVLSFTTTLADRLVSLVVDRCAERRADARLVTVTNFHALCEHTVDLAEAAGYSTVWPDGARWPVAIVDRARQAIEQGFDHRYDAILVDEGQDFAFDWWRMLQADFAVDGAEMMVTADPTQDLYRVEPWFDDATMASLGFVDPWVDLPYVVRTPPDLVAAIDVVAIDPDPTVGRRDDARSVVERAPARGSDEREHLIGPAVPSVLRWVDIDRVADLGREIGREVVRLVRDHPTLTPGDVVFLCDYHHDGLAAVREIERAGIPVHHQFSRDPAGRSVRRRRFWVGSSAVKGATVHGFKGWESGALVMGIGADATSSTLASVAVERVASPADGGSSVITIVNGDRTRRTGGASLSRSVTNQVALPGRPASSSPPPPPPSVVNGAPPPPPAFATVDPVPAPPVTTTAPPAPSITPAPPAPVISATPSVPPPPPSPVPPAPISVAPSAQLAPPDQGALDGEPTTELSRPTSPPPPPPPPTPAPQASPPPPMAPPTP